MLSRPRVCWAADIAKVPLMTARRPAVRRANPGRLLAWKASPWRSFG